MLLCHCLHGRCLLSLRSQVQRWEFDGKAYPTAEAVCNAILRDAQNQMRPHITLASIERLHQNGTSRAICHLEYSGVVPGSNQSMIQSIPTVVVDVCSGPAKPSGFCWPGRLSNIIPFRIKGTLAYGSDPSGIFGTPAPDLTGKPFTLVFHFDDSKGINQVITCIGP